MGTLYDVLGIDKDALALTIKKGYFAMVKKYPPERFPDKFMEIRNAYETLGNEKTRSEYDSILKMSNFMRINFEHAQKFIKQGEYTKAIPILETISRNFPDIATVRSYLGEAYSQNGNTVKAIGVFEQLVKEAPDNAGFAGRLARMYLDRGWQKKAISAYLRAIELDENNISLWIGLSEAYLANNERSEARKTLERSLEHENDENSESFGPIYYRLAMSAINFEDMDKLRMYLEKMTEAISEEEKENVGWSLMSITKELMHFNMYTEAQEIAKNVVKLMPGNKEAENIKNKIEILKEVEDEFSAFEDDSYDDTFKAVVFGRVFPEGEFDDDSKTSEVMRMMSEYEFVSEINSYKKQINTFKKVYPALYERVKGFFIQAMNPSLNRKMLNKYEKDITKSRKVISSILNEPAFDMFDEDDEEDDFSYESQQPIKREAPKVGRNDPCPCGSGKKYKKCCGK